MNHTSYPENLTTYVKMSRLQNKLSYIYSGSSCLSGLSHLHDLNQGEIRLRQKCVLLRHNFFFSNAMFAPHVLKLHGFNCAKNKTYDCGNIRRKMTSFYSDLELVVHIANVSFSET